MSNPHLGTGKGFTAWDGARVLITGGTGFLGSRLADHLQRLGANVISAGRQDADLRERGEATRLFARVKPVVVFHCAVDGGGIGWMKSHPVESGRDNALINVHALDASHAAGVSLFVGASSACAYPRDCAVPFRESSLWDGLPEPTNGPYAQSKRLMMELGAAYERQFGMQTRFPVLANLYGPGDGLRPDRAHVVAGLILRALEKPESLTVWGTGAATREFLYVDDAAEAMVRVAEVGSHCQPINIGSGKEVSIAELAQAVVAVTGFDGDLRFDHDKPDGQPRKCLDVAKAADELGWRSKTSLTVGLSKTVAWYRSALK